jgi:hypothetical protein
MYCSAVLLQKANTGRDAKLLHNGCMLALSVHVTADLQQ